jgi:hypothetical protein
VGIGTIKVKMFDETVKTLGNVRRASEFGRNLISLGWLDSSGYGYSARGEIMKTN